MAIEALCFATPVDHPAAKGTTITLKAALEHEIILPSKTSHIHRCIEKAAREADIAIQIACETNSASMINDLVCHGIACAIVSYGSVRSEVRSGRLATLRIVDPEITRTLCLVYSEARAHSRAMQVVRDEALSVIDDLITVGDMAWPSSGDRLG